MGVCVVVDYILKIGESSRNWAQILTIVNQVHLVLRILSQSLYNISQLLDELPRVYRDEGLMQLQLWYCHSEVCRRMNKCADALQVAVFCRRFYTAY